jgi:hypothetical protein
MAYRKAGSANWVQQVLQDARTALSIEGAHMKAHYLLGVAQRERREHGAAISHLSKALDAAREKGDAIKDDMWV